MWPMHVSRKRRTDRPLRRWWRQFWMWPMHESRKRRTDGPWRRWWRHFWLWAHAQKSHAKNRLQPLASFPPHGTVYVAGTVNVSPELLEPTAEEAFAARVRSNVAGPEYREDIGLDLKVLLLLSFAIARPKRRAPTEHDENVQHVVLTHACCELLYFGFILTPNSSRQPHAKGSFLDLIGHRNDDDGGVVLLCLCHATSDSG